MTPTSTIVDPTGRAPSSSTRRGNRRRVWKLTGLCLVIALTGWNAWWYWRDVRPLENTNTIAGWINHERYLEAEAALRERLRRRPYDTEARMMLARALAGGGDLRACALQLHQVPYWSPRKAEALYREGQSYFEINRAKDAEAAWLELIKDDPLHPIAPELLHDGCQALLKLYAIEDRWDDAYPVIWTAYDHAAAVDRPILLAMRMRPELERVAPKEAIPVIERYVAADPDDWEAVRALARAELAVGQRTEAARHFQACLEGRPSDVRPWRDYLSMLLEQGDLDAFLALLKKAPPAAETEPETWLFRGIAREKAGDLAGAAELFRKAIELNPVNPAYYYRLATTLERLGLHDQAVAHRKRTKEINDARAQLPAAYADYFAAVGAKEPKPAEIAAACKRLASICEALGWARAAEAWNLLTVSP